MNYSFWNGVIYNGTPSLVDYSKFGPEVLPILKENGQLDESVGLGNNDGLKGYGTRYFKGKSDNRGIQLNDVRQPINWDGDKMENERAVTANINGDTPGDSGGLGCGENYGELAPSNEWANLNYKQGTIGMFVGVLPEYPTVVTIDAPELPGETIIEIGSPESSDDVPPATTALVSPEPANGWNRTDVTVALAAIDNEGGAGVKEITYSAVGAQTILSTTVAAAATILPAITAEGTTTITFFATDNAGNAEAPQLIVVRVDRTTPTIVCPTPMPTFLLNQVGAVVSAAVVDPAGGSGALASPVSGGVATSTVGAFTIALSGSDQAGNGVTHTCPYVVAYGVQSLIDPTKSYKSGSTIPVKLQLLDAAGTNVSAASVVVTAVRVEQVDTTASSAPATDAGNANPDSNFRYDATLGGYIYNLQTKGLATGTWRLVFTVAGDPTPHALTFDVK